MSQSAPPDWQLPDGVDRGLWDYLHDPGIARRYDETLSETPLFRADVSFVREHCPGPASLIDLGCGTGRLLVSLAQEGWWVLGVDLSAEMLAVAQQRAREACLSVSLLRANLVHLDVVADATFDHAACLFSTLGMIVGGENRQRVLAQIHRIVRPGGRLILHVHNRWWHLRDREGRGWLLRDLWRERRRSPDAGDRIMPPHQGIGRMTMHLFTRGEIVGLLRQTGFRPLEIRPVVISSKGELFTPRLLGRWRAYGFLVAAERI